MSLPLSERIVQLRQGAMGRHGSFVHDPNPFERDVALWRAARSSLSVVQARAAMLEELARIATLRIYPHWRLAGEHLPDQAFRLLDEKFSPHLARLVELGVAEQQVPELRRRVAEWVERGRAYAIGEIVPEHDLGNGPWGRPNVFMAGGWVENHSVRDYAKVLRLGFAGIRREIEARMGRADLADPDYPRQENFWRAALSVCEAGTTLGRRYAELAARLAAEASNRAERARFAAMAESCSRVPAEGARTLHEAVQSLWLAHILTCGEDGINANSIGRLDQILHPYYRTDVEAGRITRDEAVELME